MIYAYAALDVHSAVELEALYNKKPWVNLKRIAIKGNDVSLYSTTGDVVISNELPVSPPVVRVSNTISTSSESTVPSGKKRPWEIVHECLSSDSSHTQEELRKAYFFLKGLASEEIEKNNTKAEVVPAL